MVQLDHLRVSQQASRVQLQCASSLSCKDMRDQVTPDPVSSNFRRWRLDAKPEGPAERIGRQTAA